MGILRSKISQKASYSQSSTRSTLSHCHIMQEIQEPGRPMARHKALGFFLSISVQHLSLDSKEEFPLGNGGKSLSPSLAAARSFYDLWQSRRGAIIIQYLPMVMLQFQRQSESTQPQSGLLNLSFVRHRISAEKGSQKPFSAFLPFYSLSPFCSMDNRRSKWRCHWPLRVTHY